MRLTATLRIAVRALRRNTLRTLLTLLGIIFGVAAVIAGVSIGNGAKARIEAQIAAMGQNVILIMSGNMSRGGFRMGFGSPGTLKVEDYEAIRKEVDGVAAISPEIRLNAQIAAGNQNHFPTIVGVGADYVEIRSWSFVSGANFTEADVRNANKVALIGKTAAETLFGESTDPVGQIIRIKNAPFTVVGYLKSKGLGMGLGSQDQDDVVFVPYTSAMKRLTGDTTFRSFSIQAISPEMMDDMQQQVTELLRQRHKIGVNKEDDFIVRTQREISEAATETSKVMILLLAVFGAVSLLVGGIGIMNIMLVSVTERTREIGIRMSIGARGRDILLQFLSEAVALSVVGGLIGIVVGMAASRFISNQFGWTTLISTDWILLAFAFSAAIGIFFGFYPARKAARLDPIDALRYE